MQGATSAPWARIWERTKQSYSWTTEVKEGFSFDSEPVPSQLSYSKSDYCSGHVSLLIIFIPMTIILGGLGKILHAVIDWHVLPYVVLKTTGCFACMSTRRPHVWRDLKSYRGNGLTETRQLKIGKMARCHLSHLQLCSFVEFVPNVDSHSCSWLIEA